MSDGKPISEVAATWYRVSAHADDKLVHAMPEESLRGGGVAYKQETQAVRADLNDTKRALEDKIREDGRRTRAIIGKLKINCTGRSGGEIRCTTTVPESDL